MKWFKDSDLVVIPDSLTIEEFIYGCSSLQRGGGKSVIKGVNKWDVRAKYMELFGIECPDRLLVEYNEKIHRFKEEVE